MISVQNLSVEFSARPLFDNINYVINKRDRIALVGKNGAGKSTMLKIIAGLQSPTSGQVAVPADTTVGYLPQQMKLTDTATVIEEVRKAYSHVDEMRQRLDRMNNELATREDYDSESYRQLIEHVSDLTERLAMEQSENFEAEMEKTLLGLGFVREDFGRMTAEFSGGWRMRIELAKLLLVRPDVLLLDEPTNHLDMKTKDILKQAIKDFNGTVIVVSHDREFLDGLVEKVYEFGGGQVKECLGGIYEFLEKKKLASLTELERNTIRPLTDSNNTKEPQTSAKGQTESNKTDTPAPAKKLSYAEQREREKRVRKARKKVDEAEAEIGRLEQEISEIESIIAEGNPPADIYDRHASTTKQLENAMSLWELASMEFDEISK